MSPKEIEEVIRITKELIEIQTSPLSEHLGGFITIVIFSWVFFFVLTTLMVIPGLALLLWVGRLLDSHRALAGSR